ERQVKSKAELAGIRAGNAAAAAGFTAVEQVLAESKADKKGVLQWQGKTLTAEILKEEAQVAILRKGGLCDIGLIIAPGDQAVDCHCSGSGPVRANELIVCDIYPRHIASHHYGDMTRTYLKGKANAKQRKMVHAVLEAQRRAIKAIRAGVTGAKVHTVVQDYFKSLGYKTGLVKGVYVGFFHGTGHGLGYDIHEDPALSTRNPHPLVAGNAVTVEPGLYYPGIGGCRFEDCVVITKKGCEFLSSHPYAWEIA
ncbi:MAG: Xaa-Pro peptidase family protein, partial [Opitutales bacterium]|nr:Xaa-Pro peptidase family protein [Opitutales bacterium]